MAVTEIAILKTWFETGNKPTQTQFESLIDSFHHKNNSIELPADKSVFIGNKRVLTARQSAIDLFEDISGFIGHSGGFTGEWHNADINTMQVIIERQNNKINELITLLKTHGLID